MEFEGDIQDTADNGISVDLSVENDLPVTELHPTGQNTIDDDAFLYGQSDGNFSAATGSTVKLGKRGQESLSDTEEGNPSKYIIIDDADQYSEGQEKELVGPEKELVKPLKKVVGPEKKVVGPEKELVGKSVTCGGSSNEAQDLTKLMMAAVPAGLSKKRKKLPLPISKQLGEQMKTITQDQVMAENKHKIHVVDGHVSRQFLCTVCQTALNSIRNLEAHVHSLEHVKRIKVVLLARNKPNGNWCDVCKVSCGSSLSYERHINGKKHAKILQTVRYQGKAVHPISQHFSASEKFDALFMETVVKEGDGISMGLTSTMIKFRTLDGPFIGLQYAQEVESKDDKEPPSYFCNLCNILSESGNYHLHFSSSNHRSNVLKKDYPEEFEKVKKFRDDPSFVKSKFNSLLKDAAATIEEKEGRKVGVIKRKIVIRPNIRGLAKPSVVKSVKPQGNKPLIAGLAKPGLIKKNKPLYNKPLYSAFPRAYQSGNQLTPRYPNPGLSLGQRDFGRPTFRHGGLGRQTFGYQGFGQQSLGQGASGVQPFQFGNRFTGSTPFVQPMPRIHSFGNQPLAPAMGQVGGQIACGWRGSGPRPLRPYGGWATVRPQIEVGGQTSYGDAGREGAGVGGGDVGGWGGAQREGGWRFGEGRPEEARGGRDGYDYNSQNSYPLASARSPALANPPESASSLSQQPPLPANISSPSMVHMMSMEKLKSDSGDKTDGYKALALDMIKSEDDAERAFQLSSGLTQALLEYRMKSFSNPWN